MSLKTTFNRIKREIGIKKCVILDGNVGDVYLNQKKQLVDLKQYLADMLKELEYDSVLYWDRVDGLDGDISGLDVIDEVNIEGEEYSFDDEEKEVSDTQKDKKTGIGLFKEPAEIFNIVFKNLKKPNRKIAFILNWADYLFSVGGQLPPDERELLTVLGKSVKNKKVEYLSAEVNESCIVLIANKLSMFPISFYQGNPEVACLTLPRPDREERERMLEKIESGFDVKMKPGETLLTCEKKNEYIDMLDDFTNREIVQMARLSRKEPRMPFEQLYLLFKYGEKDNPWEKLDYKAVKNIKRILGERVVGQEEAIAKIEKVVVKAYMGLSGLHKSSSRAAPKGVLFFVGPTGVGKTELSKALAKFLFGDEQACIRFDMSEYAQENSDQKLIGAPPGYVGYEEGGQLSEKVRRNPYSVVLFDEIEKASPDVFNVLLQVLDDGHITDGQGRKVDFKNTVIIMTSNAGARSIVEPKRVGFTSMETEEQSYQNMKKNVMEEVRHIFKPEFLNRIDDMIVFHSLTQEDILEIVKLMTKTVSKRIKENMDITVAFTDKALEKIAEEGYDKAFGARPLRRAIQSRIEDAFAEEYLMGNFKAGDKVSVGVKTNGFLFRVVK